jgi:hypothetical protein
LVQPRQNQRAAPLHGIFCREAEATEGL